MIDLYQILMIGLLIIAAMTIVGLGLIIINLIRCILSDELLYLSESNGYNFVWTMGILVIAYFAYIIESRTISGILVIIIAIASTVGFDSTGDEDEINEFDKELSDIIHVTDQPEANDEFVS